ncbi:MAG: LytTR family DNA-binding domain-containing protein [Bacteroidota bacterium]
MEKIKCLLIDDELPAIQLLEEYAGMIEQLEVVASCDNALQAFGVLKAEEIDLLFLDVNMPLISGVDFVKALRHPPAIVFTTAYREYAVESYEMGVLDYLLKPFSFERFLKSVDKYRVADPEKYQRNAPVEEYVFFKVNRTNHKVILDDVLYLEGLKDYTRIHTTNDNLTVRGNLNTNKQKLPKHKFVRVHRSFVVATARINAYNQSEVIVQGVRLPLGMAYRESFLRVVGK